MGSSPGLGYTCKIKAIKKTKAIDESQLNQPICGTTAAGKIVGGSDADIRDYPFNVWVLSNRGTLSKMCMFEVHAM